jgi:hypothetical protein
LHKEELIAALDEELDRDPEIVAAVLTSEVQTIPLSAQHALPGPWQVSTESYNLLIQLRADL